MLCVTGPLQHPWTPSKTQSHSASNRSHEDIFFSSFPKKHIYLFLVTLQFVCLFLSAPAPLTLSLKPCWWSRRVCSPLPSFNTTAAENQTPLKQIDVPFNTVITSSQSPRVSVLVTTAGLLSWAQRWLSRFRLLQWFITKKEREFLGKERKEKGIYRKKNPQDHGWITETFDWQCLIRLSPA